MQEGIYSLKEFQSSRHGGRQIDSNDSYEQSAELKLIRHLHYTEWWQQFIMCDFVTNINLHQPRTFLNIFL